MRADIGEASAILKELGIHMGQIADLKTKDCLAVKFGTVTAISNNIASILFPFESIPITGVPIKTIEPIAVNDNVAVGYFGSLTNAFVLMKNEISGLPPLGNFLVQRGNVANHSLNYDDITTTGIYYVPVQTAISNSPALATVGGSKTGTLIVYNNGNNQIIQKLYSWDGLEQFERFRGQSTGWRPWVIAYLTKSITPSLCNSSGTNYSVDYSIREGVLTIIQGVATLNWRLQLSSKGSASGTIYIKLAGIDIVTPAIGAATIPIRPVFFPHGFTNPIAIAANYTGSEVMQPLVTAPSGNQVINFNSMADNTRLEGYSDFTVA